MNKNLDATMRQAGIDVAASQLMLDRLNAGDGQPATGALELSIPSFDGQTVLDGRGNALRLRLARSTVPDRLRPLLPGNAVAEWIDLDAQALTKIGSALLPELAFGLLNGGAATSFVDITRNQAAYPDYFPLVVDLFESQGQPLVGKPKALAPAYFHADGRPGKTFLELKILALERLSRNSRGRLPTALAESRPCTSASRCS